MASHTHKVLKFIYLLQFILFYRQWKTDKNPPSVIIAGCGLWSIKTSNASLSVLEEYSVNLTRLVQPIEVLQEKKTRVLWTLLAPVNSAKLKPDFQMISNAQIDLYNKAAIEVNMHLLPVESIWK